MRNRALKMIKDKNRSMFLYAAMIMCACLYVGLCIHFFYVTETDATLFTAFLDFVNNMRVVLKA